MRIILSLCIIPFLVQSQEFYPGHLLEIDSPICYSTSTELTFETLPTGLNESSYTFQWQKSWNQSNWFNIEDATSINYSTDFLNTDTYYRVAVTYENVSVFTNTIAVYVLPPIDSGILMEVGSICVNDIDNPIYFEVEPSGAELSWGGFSQFTYQWQQGNISENNIIDLSIVDWVNVGDNSNTLSPNVDQGLYCFRCIVNSPYGCGTAVTDAIIVQIDDCFNSQFEEVNLNKKIICNFNILAQENENKGLMINIYENGDIEKKYILE